METMGNLRRTKYCGRLRAENVGEEITVAGSCAKCRDKGGVIFADLRDTSGILQLIFDDGTDREIFEKASTLRSEYVLIAKGTVRERQAKTDKIATGDVELFVTEMRILSEAKTSPFEIRDEIKVKDELRLKYRYLDLRRPIAHEPLVLRSRIAKIVRDYYCDNDFTEIETPMLIGSTPEGARDYLVPSRVQPGHFYALPQSPQLYKQLLMLSGFDRYFQIARCFRDEDLRADRQPEFTQIDMEMSFVTEDDIMEMNEGLVKRIFKEIYNHDVKTPFLRMPYSEAMERFGSDKPDLRFGIELVDISPAVKDSEFVVFKGALEKGSVRCINAKGLADRLTRKEIDKLVEVAKTYGAKGLAYTRLTDSGETSSYEKFLTPAEIAAVRDMAQAETGDVILIVADAKDDTVFAALGALRLEIAKKFELFDKNEFNFLWVTDFPLFEYSEEDERYVAKHHPFTMPKDEDMDKVETAPGECRAKAYDMILNGCELGGGSIRINNPALQARMFKALGFTEERAQNSFGYLMEAYEYGAPPHGGMAFGFDRLVMLMTRCESIRDVIAFPKVQNASELMTGTPGNVEEKQLRELSIKLDIKE
ncbi:MAG: aspartate--tRNA ligase [Oscillospiraceae bacterium]